jgi:hypothetical protein
VAALELPRERIEGTGELEDLDRGLVDVGKPAAALHRDCDQPAIRSQLDAEHGADARVESPRDRRIVQRAESLDLGAPGFQIGCDHRCFRVGSQQFGHWQGRAAQCRGNGQGFPGKGQRDRIACEARLGCVLGRRDEPQP